MTRPYIRDGVATSPGMVETSTAVNAQHRPSRRRTVRGKSDGPDAFLWVYEDPARGLCLVRGKSVLEVLKLANLGDIARWSVSARGWVIPLDKLADLAAMADYNGTPYRVREVGE